MTIRTRTLIIISAMFIGFVVASYVSSSTVLLRGFAQIERQEAQKNVERVINALNDSISVVNSKAADWASWDDAYEFVVGHSKEQHRKFIKSNVTENVLHALQVNIVLFLHPSGHIVAAKAIDLETRKQVPFPAGLHQHLLESRFLQHEHESDSHSGLILVGDKPMMVVARPILTSDGEGPIHGTIVMGRYLDERESARLADETHVTFRFDDLQAHLGSDDLDRLHSKGAIVIKPADEDLLYGYTLLRDVSGRPMATLRVEMARDVFNQGKRITRYLLATLLLTGIMVSMTAAWFSEKWVSSRLIRLSETMRTIGFKGESSERVQVEGKDEVSVLASSINSMLDRMDEYQHELLMIQQELDARVHERTAELTCANEVLQVEITERGRVETALRQERDFAESLILLAQVIVLVLDKEGRILRFNPYMERVCGYSLEEVKGMDWFNLFVPESKRDQRREIFHQTLAGAPLPDKVSLLLTRNGQQRKIEWHTKTLTDAENRCIGQLYIGHDVTERLRLEEQLRQSQKMEAIGTLAGGIAHDFNNILTPIVAYTDIVLYELPEQSPLRFSLEQVLNAAYRAKDMIKQILTFSRKGEQEQKPVPLGLLIKEALRLIRASLPATIEIQHHFTVSDGEDTILADPVQIHQVLMNLCTNAAQAMQATGGILELALTRINFDESSSDAGLGPGAYLRLTVSDTGCGMESEVIEKIFDPYFTTKQPGEGTGLGLAVVHGIIKAHGGIITVYSKPGQGTSFHILLPKVDPSSPAQGAEALPPMPTGNERLLLVDDEPSILEVGKAVLSMLGYEVTATSSSVEALEAFEAHPTGFDAVITDLTMPHITGLDLAHKLLNVRPDMPVILCTGFSDTLTRQRSKDLGIRELLMKPMSIHDLAGAVRRALDGGSGFLHPKD